MSPRRFVVHSIRNKNHKWLILIAMPLLAVPVSVVAAPRAPLQPAPAKAPAAYEAVRAALGAYLEEKAGGAIALPAFPQEKLLVWVDERSGAVGKEDAARYRLLGEHLLIAARLMEGEDLATRKRGYWIASESANFAAARLQADKALLARIYEAYLLPKVALANTEIWQDPSRTRILEQGVSAFGNAGERDKQIRVLEWILSVGQRQPAAKSKKGEPEPLTLELNTLDWARGTLAATLSAPHRAPRPDLERAVTLLEAIQSPDMTGFGHLQGVLKKRLEQLPENDKALAP